MNFNIVTEYGGLGDQLFYTHIPELIKTRFPNANINVTCRRKLRSASTFEFVWGSNPYVDSFERDLQVDSPVEAIEFNKNDNLLARLAKNLGFDCECTIAPKLYREIEKLPQFADKVVIDPNYNSYVGAYSKKKVKEYLSGFDNVVVLNNPGWLNLDSDYQTAGIEEYAAIIKSCKEFICFTSGGATLASALKKPAICIYGLGQDDIFHHCNDHTYINISHNMFRAFFINIYLKVRNKFRHLKLNLR